MENKMIVTNNALLELFDFKSDVVYKIGCSSRLFVFNTDKNGQHGLIDKTDYDNNITNFNDYLLSDLIGCEIQEVKTILDYKSIELITNVIGALVDAFDVPVDLIELCRVQSGNYKLNFYSGSLTLCTISATKNIIDALKEDEIYTWEQLMKMK